jgi:hypothetical protein
MFITKFLYPDVGLGGNGGGAADPTPTSNNEPTEPITSTEPPVNAGSGEVTNPPVEEKPVQSAEVNAQYAKIRREAEQAARDKTIAEMGMTWNGQPITTYAQYQQAIQEKQAMDEAQQRNIDPQLYAEFKSMQNKLNSYEREKSLMSQDIQLEGDEKIGAIYKEWKSEVHDMANKYNCDYETAFTLLTREKLPDLLSKKELEGQQTAIKNIKTNASTTPGAAGQGGEVKATIKDMGKKDFDDLVEKVKRGEIKSLT